MEYECRTANAALPASGDSDVIDHICRGMDLPAEVVGSSSTEVVIAKTTRSRVDTIRERSIRAFAGIDFALSEARRASAGHGATAPQRRVDGYAACIHIAALTDFDVWRDSERVATTGLPAGSVHIDDMRHEWRGDIRSPFHVVNFFIPQAAIDQLAVDYETKPLERIICPINEARVDPVFASLIAALRPALANPTESDRLFTDCAARSILLHIARTYGSMRPCPVGGGLAPWQARRAKELLLARISGDVSLCDVARTCRMSPGHFSQAFRRTFGLPPHQWLLSQRVERAKSLILNSRQSLSEIALATGFSDQSHFTRVFSQHIKVAPGAWRRLQAR